MDKEKEPISDAGFSEKELDLAVDRTAIDDQVKGSKVVFDSQKKKKKLQEK